MADPKPKEVPVDVMERIAVALEALAMRHGELSHCEKHWGPLPGSKQGSGTAPLSADELAKLRAVLNG